MNIHRRLKSPLAYGLVVAVAVGGAALCQNESRLDAAPPSKETVRFDVWTPSGSDIVIDGVFVDDGNGSFVSDGSGMAAGRGGKSGVVVNRPAPAVKLDFLADHICFDEGGIYGGSIAIFQPKQGGPAMMSFFFRWKGKDGSLVGYRLDGEAEIRADNGGIFPDGDTQGYTVTVRSLRVSVDTGKQKNGCTGDFDDAVGIIRLDRINE